MTGAYHLDKLPTRFVKLKPRAKVPEGARRIETADTALADAWQGEGYNVGIVPGDEIVIVDIDPRNGGHATFAGLCEHQQKPSTVISLTGGDGLHMFFRWDTAWGKPRGTLGAGVDVKYGDNCHVVAPGSVHPNGSEYRWKPGNSPADVEVALCPAWLRDLLVRTNTALSPNIPANPQQLPPETPEEVAKVQAMLRAIPANCDREKWRNVVWAVMATGWKSAGILAREWSMTAPEKFDDTEFQTVVRSFEPAGGIGFGTLVHIAREHGHGGPLPGGPAASDPVESALHKFNKRHFVAKVGGKVYVFDEVDPNILAGGMAFTACRQFHAGHMVNGVNIAAKWLVWASRRTYSKLMFDPGGKDERDVFNTWRGLAVKPMDGSSVLIRAHIHEVWCGGNSAQFEYVMWWLALLVQRPWIKPEVALVLRSREGSGKTIIVQMLLIIFGVHGFTAAQKDQVAGRFNGHLFDKVLVVLEEAFFAGDPAAVSATKALVTNETLGYEAKGKDAFSAPNYAHVISLTNNDWAVPAGDDSRRWMVLDVSDKRKGDHAYFAALSAEIKSGGTEAFLKHLLAVDLDGWNPRALPDSHALRAQQAETLMRTNPVAAWLFHVLADGAFTVDGGAEDWQREISAGVLQESYRAATTRARSAPTWDAAAKKLRTLLPPGSLVRVRKCVQGGRAFYYGLPDLDEARAHFKTITGVDPCEA